MNFSSLKRLIQVFVARDFRGAFFSAFGIALGVGALVFFVALGLGVGRVVRENVFPVDSQLVDVVPSSISLGNLWGGGKIDQATVDRIAKLPQVSAVYRKMNVRVPAVTRFDGNFFGARLRMGAEVTAIGVDPEFVANEVKPEVFVDAPPGQPIPVVMSKRLLEIYNKTFAPSRRLPQISTDMVVGFEFPVEFNRSYVSGIAGATASTVSLQVVGTSQRTLLAGITIPLATAIRMNQHHQVDAENYSAMTLKARHPDDVPALVKEIKEMGLEIDDQERRWAQNVGAAVAVTTSAMGLLSVLICILAAVNIGHALAAAVRARAREIGVMRAVGASRRDIRLLVFSEAGFLGLVGGLAGVVGARLLGWVVDGLASTVLPPFPFKPHTYFEFSWMLLLGGTALGLLAAWIGASWPARHAAAQEPARVLAG